MGDISCVGIIQKEVGAQLWGNLHFSPRKVDDIFLVITGCATFPLTTPVTRTLHMKYLLHLQIDSRGAKGGPLWTANFSTSRGPEKKKGGRPALASMLIQHWTYPLDFRVGDTSFYVPQIFRQNYYYLCRKQLNRIIIACDSRPIQVKTIFQAFAPGPQGRGWEGEEGKGLEGRGERDAEGMEERDLCLPRLQNRKTWRCPYDLKQDRI
jgi:hypothetical protein